MNASRVNSLLVRMRSSSFAVAAQLFRGFAPSGTAGRSGKSQNGKATFGACFVPRNMSSGRKARWSSGCCCRARSRARSSMRSPGRTDSTTLPHRCNSGANARETYEYEYDAEPIRSGISSSPAMVLTSKVRADSVTRDDRFLDERPGRCGRCCGSSRRPSASRSARCSEPHSPTTRGGGPRLRAAR